MSSKAVPYKIVYQRYVLFPFMNYVMTQDEQPLRRAIEIEMSHKVEISVENQKFKVSTFGTMRRESCKFTLKILQLNNK